MAKRTPVTRLDQMLVFMEQQLALLSALCRLVSQSRPNPKDLARQGLVGHYKELRQHLLDIRTPEEFDLKRFSFVRDGIVGQLAEDSWKVYGELALKLAVWVTRSRRVYAIDEDLQLMLLATSFGKKRCCDIPWPLDTFGLAVATPVRMVVDGKAFYTDFFFSSRPRELLEIPAIVKSQPLTPFAEESVRIAMLSSKLGRWNPLSEKVLQRLETTISLADVERQLDKATLPGDPAAITFCDGMELALPGKTEIGIEAALEAMRENDEIGSVLGRESVWRIIIALCFFQETLRNDSTSSQSYVEHTARKPHTMDLSAITETSEICTVSSTHVLEPGQREQLREWARRGGGYELPFHFRINHKRRPWGTRHIPGQEKTVQIPMTMVNRVRLPEKAQAAGTKVTLRSR